MNALIVTGHPLVALGLKTALEARRPEVRCVIGDHFERSEDANIDIVVLDLDAGFEPAQQQVLRVRAHHPTASLVVITSRPDRSEECLLSQLGTAAYLEKTMGMDELIGTLATLARVAGRARVTPVPCT